MMRARLLSCVAVAAALAFLAPAASAQMMLTGVGPGAPASGAASPPTFNWATGSSIVNFGTSLVTNSTGHSIASGDYLLMVGGPTDDATTSFTSFTCTGGAAWTTLSMATGSNPETTTFFSHISKHVACGRVAGAGESGAYTIAWTGASDRNSVWTLIDIAAGTYNATPIDVVSSNTMDTTVQSFDALTVTTTKANDLLVSVYPLWHNSDAADPATKTAGMTLKLNTFDASFEPEVLVLTSLPGLGATGTKNVTTTNAGGTIGQGWNIAIKGL